MGAARAFVVSLPSIVAVASALAVASSSACSSGAPAPADDAPRADGTQPPRGGPAAQGSASDPAPPPPGSSGGAASGGAPAGEDSDADGIPDDLEASYAAAYMPFVSVHPSDGCPTHGIAYRIAPHPSEPGRVMIWADVLYDVDCGANGHHGDDEMFGAVVDPSKPAPAGILAVRAISHQGTPCEHASTCGSCPGMTACATAEKGGTARPVVFPSKDKHGNYVDEAACDASLICDFGGCAQATAPDTSPMVNVGEPGHPLVTDLTSAGLVTAANGWTSPELTAFDPWKPGDFGGAGDVSKDLVDPAFVIDTTACP
jgi:hypothetical protein